MRDTVIDDNIRKYARANVDVNDKVEVQILKISNELSGKSITKPISITPLNLSTHGMKFVTRYRLPVGIKVTMEVMINRKKIVLNGKITRVLQEAETEFYDCAVKFTDIAEFDAALINEFIKKKTVLKINELRSQ